MDEILWGKAGKGRNGDTREASGGFQINVKTRRSSANSTADWTTKLTRLLRSSLGTGEGPVRYPSFWIAAIMSLWLIIVASKSIKTLPVVGFAVTVLIPSRASSFCSRASVL